MEENDVVLFEPRGKRLYFGFADAYGYKLQRGQRTSYVQLAAAAKECRDKALIDIRQNKVIIHELTVQECYEKSLDLFVTNVKTKQRHDLIFRQMVPEKFLTKKISALTAADIQSMINAFAQDHTADALSRTISIWRQIYRAALMSGCPVADQSQMVIMPKAKKPQATRRKHCTVEDLETFIEDGLLEYNSHTPEGRKTSRDIYLAIRIMQYLGLRPQEVFALCAEDIDLENGLIYVQRSIGSTATANRQLIATKTSDSVRVLPIPDALDPVLREMLTHDTRPLLTDLDGLPYDTSKVSVFMYNVVKTKKVPHINLYMLRHMFGTDMSRQNVKMAQSMMGHESAKMTLGYAQKTSVEEMREALNKRFS